MVVVWALLFLAVSQCCYALLEEPFIAFESSDGTIELHSSTILYDSEDPEAVQIAVRSLVGDLGQITGTEPATCKWSSNITSSCSNINGAIIIGTIDSSLIQYLERHGKITVSDIQGKWETFKTTVVTDPLPGFQKALVLAGSDKRGTAFGVYTLSEQSGQSPLHFWADVPAAKHDKVYALPQTTIHGPPTVKYRGLFINDEAPALTGWWARKANVSDYTLGADFYAEVFDLILRLKGNFMWPAMWASFVPEPGRIFFTDDPGNQQLADDYGIVMSTSHHEPMQRATNEWAVVGEGPWNWVENKQNIVSFMDEGIRRAGNNESYFTLGMRGENDGPVEGDDPMEILKDIFATERALIAKHYGNESAVPQVWTVYKEVQAYYEAGLVPAEDVTLIFSDDNWGNIRRLPTAHEANRGGGIGVYYHLAYVGVPKAYKWQNTNNLPKLYKELYQAQQRGADQIWIFNIEDIKPLELPFSFVMDLAWNTSNIDSNTISNYLEKFSVRDFGPDLAKEAASVLLDYSHLVGMRKFEMTQPETYSILNYHETDRILEAWKDVSERAKSIHSRLPKDRRDAFFHHAVYPAVAGANFYSIMIGRAKNAQYADERRNSANDVASAILDDFAKDWDLVLEYDQLAGGKWAGIMSTPKFDIGLDTWRPSSRDVIKNISYVQTLQDFDYGFGNLGIYAQGSRSAWWQGRICASSDRGFPTEGDFKPRLPALTPYGPDYVTADLFHRGDHRKSIAWSVESPFEWLNVSQTSGVVSSEQPEQRLYFTVDWEAVPADFKGTFDVRVNWEPAPHFDNIVATVLNNQVPVGFSGFPQVDKIISIEAPHFQQSSSGDVTFEPIPHLGTRSESGSIALRPYTAARENISAAEAAWVDYTIFIFGPDPKPLNMTIYINGALDTDPGLAMMFSLSLDGAFGNFTRLLLDPPQVGDLPGDWEASVADHVWKRTVVFGEVGLGEHRIRFSVDSPELYLEKIVVEFGEAAPYSYLGPPETMLL